MHIIKLIIKVWYKLLALFLLGISCLFVVEAFFQSQFDQIQRDMARTQLEATKFALEDQIGLMVKLNLDLVRAMQGNPNMSQTEFARVAEALFIKRQNSIVNFSISKAFLVTLIYPTKTNDYVLGLDYRTRPDVMISLNRAIQLRDTIVSGPVRLIQNGRLGIIIRTPIFDNQHHLLGIASTAVDLESLVQTSGALDSRLPFEIALRGQEGLGEKGEIFFGNSNIFKKVDFSVNIHFPNGHWNLLAVLKEANNKVHPEIWMIRVTILSLTCIWAVILLRKEYANQEVGMPSLHLRFFFMGSVFFILLPVLTISGLHTYYVMRDTTDQYTQQLMTEVSNRVNDRVHSFFETPRRTLAYTIDRMNSHIFPTENREELIRELLVHVRQQWLITFMSIGLKDGSYLSITRAPTGEDKGLRLLSAKVEDHFKVNMYRIDSANRYSSQIETKKTEYFDARTRPWFQAAIKHGSMLWYPAYRYGMDYFQESYNTLGIGMSAPLYDDQGNLVAVCAVDLALSQLNLFLKEMIRETGGTVFIMEPSGALLAASSGQTYADYNKKFARISAEKSTDALIRAANVLIKKNGRKLESNGLIEVDNQRYLTDWRAYTLPQGPTLTIVTVLPEAHFAAPTQSVLQNGVALGVAILMLSLLLSFFVTDWIARPLLNLNQKAQRIAKGLWKNDATVIQDALNSPIQEVSSLARALLDMGTQLKQHTDRLEHLVEERTAALAEANRQLTHLASTDGLTTLANRRHFDMLLIQEWQRARVQQWPLGLLMLDVDFFKKYNDQYGHQAGDICLQTVANTLKQCTPEAPQFVARYGGEEFVCMVPCSHWDHLSIYAERIREAIFVLNLPHKGSPLQQVTVSIGAAQLLPDDTTSYETLLSLADAALYRAKKAGRNGVVLMRE